MAVPFGFIVAKNTNPAYHVHIFCVGLGFELVADMPEQTAYAVAADYEAQLPASTGDMGVANGVTFVTGTHATLQALTKQIWRNSSPIEIPITLQFDAYSDAFQEVYKPMRILEALAMPTVGTGGAATFAQKVADVANAVGKYFGYDLGVNGTLLVGPNSGGNTMSVVIGRMLTLSELLLISCNNTYDSRMTDQGYPISGQSELVFRTSKVLSRAEWVQATGSNFTPL